MAVENAVADLKGVLDEGDKESIEAKTTALAEASATVAQKLYAEQAAEQGEQESTAEVNDEDVVDAEFEEIEEGEDKKSD